MKIDRIELFHVAMPLISPWRTAYGEDAAIHAVLCRMTSGSCSAWGESSPLAAPCYSPEWGGGIFAVCREWLAPTLLHQDVVSGEDLQQRLGHFKGNPFAKAILDATWWNLQSRIENKPLHQLLGEFAGCTPREEVPVGADFGVLDSIDELLACVDDAVEQKFPRIKLKFRPGWDLPMLRAVRAKHPTHPIHIDCNSGYRISDLPLFREVDELNLAMIEQPLQHDDLIDHAELQRSIRTPVCLDESLVTLRQAQQAIAIGSCRYANIKPARVGGLKAGIPCWVGGMLESATGVATCVALAMLPNFTYPADIFPSSRFYHEDLSDPPLELIRTREGLPGVRAPHTLPEPNPDRLKKMTMQYWST
jgi:O-succinylbenzoate synthase